ncbi:MAG: beta-galactosidase [Desulfobacteraceae bacterium]
MMQDKTGKNNFSRRMKVVRSILKSPEFPGNRVDKQKFRKRYIHIKEMALKKDTRAFSQLDQLIFQVHHQLKGKGKPSSPGEKGRTHAVLPEGTGGVGPSYEDLVLLHASITQRIEALEKLSGYLKKKELPVETVARQKQTLEIDAREAATRLKQIESLVIAQQKGEGDNNRGSPLVEYAEELETVSRGISKLELKAGGQGEPTGNILKKYASPLFFGIQTFGKRDFFKENGYYPRLLKRFGFDFVSFHPHSVNHSMAMGNPERGVYDFNPYKRLAKSLAPYDLGLRLTVEDSGFHGVDNYWMKKDNDEVTWIDGKGKTLDRMGAHSTLNIWNPAVTQWVNEYAAALVKEMKQYDNISVYEVFNEPVMFIDKPVGYGKFASSAFRRYLKKLYGNDIERLNSRWKTAYDTFDSIVPPRDLSPQTSLVKTGQIYDFQKFRQKSYAKFMSSLIKEIKTQDKNARICSQFYERLKVRKKRDKTNMITGGIDLYQLAMLDWDILGNHDWPDSTEAVDFLYTYSINRYAACEMWDDEFVWTAWEGFSDRAITRKMTRFKNNGEQLMRNVMKRNIWRHINWSKRGLIFFDLDDPWPGWNYALLDPESSKKVMRYCTGVIPVVKKKAEAISDVLVNSRIKNSGVYVLFSNVSRLVSFPHGKSVDLCRKTVKELLVEKLIPFVVPEAAILDGREDLSQCRVLICPYTTHMDIKSCKTIADWVKSGGRLILAGPCGKLDPYGRLSKGMYHRFFETSLSYDASRGIWAGDENAPLEKCTTRFGKGRVDFYPSNRLDIGKMVKPVVSGFQLVSTDQNWFEIIPRITRSGEEIVVVQNLSPEKRLAGRVYVKGQYKKAVDLSLKKFYPSGPSLSLKEKNTVFSLNLSPGGVSVIRLE